MKGDIHMTAANVALIETLRDHGLSLAVAESLTGGGLCSRLVDVPGASDVLRGGVCTYATDTKHTLLSVPATLLAKHGPVHPDVAAHMARGVATMFNADASLATTGVAGPGPADGHPAGTVYIACSLAGNTHVTKFQFTGERAQIRHATIDAAITMLLTLLQTGSHKHK